MNCRHLDLDHVVAVLEWDLGRSGATNMAAAHPHGVRQQYSAVVVEVPMPKSLAPPQLLADVVGEGFCVQELVQIVFGQSKCLSQCTDKDLADILLRDVN